MSNISAPQRDGKSLQELSVPCAACDGSGKIYNEEWEYDGHVGYTLGNRCIGECFICDGTGRMEVGDE